MAATFTSHISLDDFARIAARSDPSTDSPVLQIIAEARAKGYVAVSLPLANEKWQARWKDLCLLSGESAPDKEAIERRAEAWRAQPAFTRDEVIVTRLDEAEGIVAMVSEWLELDAADDWIRHDAEIALQQELSWASYLNIQAAILPPPRNRQHVAAYARAINACLNTIPYMQLSVLIPIYDPSVFQHSPLPTRLFAEGSSSSPSSYAQPSIATWEMWDTVRSLCDYNPRLSIALDLTPPLPSELGVLNQWLAEPVRHLFLPASAFIANAKGYPVLPKGTQSFIRSIMKLQPNVILSGTASGKHTKGGESAYTQYIRHLEKTSPAVQAAQTAGTVEHFARGYQDFLQTPLQPLMDNLQSVTYHTFEQDPVKYKSYEEAVFLALKEWRGTEQIKICVAGAGRGPLVVRCLNALKRSKRDAFIYVLEKNPNAFVTLQERLKGDWASEKIALIYGDMRAVQMPEKVDIVVSELLGSFGDNELSPECLDGAMRFLKPDGISIPASYTAHLAPLSSTRLYNETRTGNDQKAAETPYVVMLHSINILSSDSGGLSGKCGPKIQECWEFEHPRRDAVLNDQGLPLTNSHNARSACLSFAIPHAGVLHGLAGYFEAVLYGNIGLSTHPERKDEISKDMLSWFPLFFPFKDPLYLPSNSELQVSIWRLTNQRQVWYEWSAEAFLPVAGSSSLRDKEEQTQMVYLDRSSFSSALNSPSPLSKSPLADADPLDLPSVVDPSDADAESGKQDIGLIKIGQTALHNPRGRSSWIGL